MYICTHFIGVLEGYLILDPRSVHLLPADMGGATLWELQQLIQYKAPGLTKLIILLYSLI